MLEWRFLVGITAAAAACGGGDRVTPGQSAFDAEPGGDGGPASDAHVQVGCTDAEPCYTVFAHSDTVLYHIDLANQSLVEIGPFDTPAADVITDLAVSPADELWGVSEASYLYSVDRATGAATQVTSLAACGAFSVALSFTPDGNLYAGDYNGAFCRIDLGESPPDVIPIGTLGNDLALAGDMVAISDGTLFGTAYDLGDGATTSNNLLVTIDPATGHATPQGSTTYPNLYGIAFEQEAVFAFTHDGSGRVVTVDPSTGVGTLYGTFTEPGSDLPISFAGAAVNPDVPSPVD